MTESAELTHEVLLRVAEFLRKLPTDQLQDLAVRLSEPRGRDQAADRAAPPAAGPGRDRRRSPCPARSRRSEPTCPACRSGAAAATYLDELKLSAAQLRSLALGLGIAVSSKATKAQARDTIVQWTVGRRADAVHPLPARSRRVF